MAKVWLVGEDTKGCRVLFDRAPTYIECLDDVNRAVERRGFELTGRTGYVLPTRTMLEGGNIAAPVNPDPEYSVSPPELGTGVLFDGLWLLYRVQEKVSDQSARRVRLLVDFCLGIGVCVHAVEKLLKTLAGIIVGWRVVERNWREALLLRDLAFLMDTKEVRAEGRLFLLHDLCPQNKDPADGRKLGHLTAAYRNGAGKKVHHTLAVYTELSSSGSVQDKYLEKTFEYFERLREAVGDDVGFDENSFAAMFTDRGASLGKYDTMLTRLFEPVHRVHRVLIDVVEGYDAAALMRTVCKAANFMSTPSAFHAFLERRCAAVDGVQGLLWQRASSGRFGSAIAACFVLGSRVGGSPLHEHLLSPRSNPRSKP
jgi:hypothetical protein